LLVIGVDDDLGIRGGVVEEGRAAIVVRIDVKLYAVISPVSADTIRILKIAVVATHEEVKVIGVVPAIDFGGVIGGVRGQHANGVIAAVVKSAAVVADEGNVPRSALTSAHEAGEFSEIPIGWIPINGERGGCW